MKDNYYEYAPPLFKGLFEGTNIAPWTLFSIFFWGSLIIGIICLFILPIILKRWCRWYTRIGVAIIGLLLLVFGTRIDKPYLAYERIKACSEPGIYIKRQVEANGYLSLQNFKNTLSPEQLKRLKDTSVHHTEDKWTEKEPSYCESIIQYEGYQFYEDAVISVGYRSNDVLEYDRAIKFRGLKGGQCYSAYLSKPTSRYYIIKGGREQRVGLGLFKNKTYIIDSYTGEEIAHAYRYKLSTNALYKLIAGGFGSTDSYCNNHTITTDKGVAIKEYRKKGLQTEAHNSTRMERYTLIPSQYFNAPSTTQIKESSHDTTNH